MPYIHAIGDVHGRPDLLQHLIDFIEAGSDHSGVEPRVFFLGDIVDRGYNSRGAMEIVRKTLERWPRSRLILGNHDEMFLQILRDPQDGDLSRKWLANGGRQTMYSYFGFEDGYQPHLIADILARFPDHYDLLANASDIETVGRYAFVHAGIEPHLPLRDQDPIRCRRIRDEFLDHVGPLSHVVVHGHTTLAPPRPAVTENRISLDTFAYHSGVLSMAAINPETDDAMFFSTHPDGSVRQVEPVLLDRGLGTALKAA